MKNPTLQQKAVPTKVWIVDDEPISRFIIRKCIPSDAHFKVVGEFEDGKDAFDRLKEVQPGDCNFPDVIILDVNMPFMDAWDFMSQFEQLFLKEEAPKVFILSSSEHKDDIAQSKKYPAIQEYLVKPTSVDDMERTLARHFSLEKKVV